MTFLYNLGIQYRKSNKFDYKKKKKALKNNSKKPTWKNAYAK